MNWLDILIIVTLVVSFIGGLGTGLLRGVMSLAGLIVGIILAGKYYPTVAGWLGFIPSEDIANVVGFILILSLVMIIAGILGQILKSVASAIMLGWLDRLGGAVLGLFMGFISWSIFLALWAKFFGGDWIAHSALAQVMLDKFPLILSFLPTEFDAVRDFFK